MKAVPLLAAVVLAGCSTTALPPERPRVALIDSDRGGLVGNWRGPFTLSTMEADRRGSLTYAAAAGCVVSQGVLRPLGNDRYRVERYDGRNFPSDRCGHYRVGPAVAPFDGPEVLLRRTGKSLFVSGGGTERSLVRDTGSDLILPDEALLGRWLLAEAGRPLPPATGASLTIDERGYTILSACGSVSGNGVYSAPGLFIRMGGNFLARTPTRCQVRTRGDRLTEAAEGADWRYLPDSDRLQVRLGRERMELVRG